MWDAGATERQLCFLRRGGGGEPEGGWVGEAGSPVCVCLCVCVCEREREREQVYDYCMLPATFFPPSSLSLPARTSPSTDTSRLKESATAMTMTPRHLEPR